jgi:RimJ/RimL family protein N-acetyltransferase
MQQSEGQAMKITVNEHIHLSEFQPSDQVACVDQLREKEIYDRTLRIPYPYKDADFQEWLKIIEKATQQQGRPVHWAIRKEDGLLIGGCGLDDFQVGKSHRAEIGYWLAKPFWGRGIMTAVVRRVCEFAFTEFGLVRITAHVFINNPASASVLEKAGFQQEGYLRKHYLKDGRYVDARLFAFVKE